MARKSIVESEVAIVEETPANVISFVSAAPVPFTYGRPTGARKTIVPSRNATWQDVIDQMGGEQDAQEWLNKEVFHLLHDNTPVNLRLKEIQSVEGDTFNLEIGELQGFPGRKARAVSSNPLARFINGIYAVFNSKGTDGVPEETKTEFLGYLIKGINPWLDADKTRRRTGTLKFNTIGYMWLASFTLDETSPFRLKVKQDSKTKYTVKDNYLVKIDFEVPELSDEDREAYSLLTVADFVGETKSELANKLVLAYAEVAAQANADKVAEVAV